LFLDVELPEINGIDLLKQNNFNAQTILITSDKKYAVDGFEQNVTDFLLKPIAYSRFLTAVNKARKLIATNNYVASDNYLYVKSNKDYVKIEFHDILWIQSASEYIMIYTKNGKHLIYSNMKDILEKLNHNFMQIHRSYIIPLDKIDQISKKYVVINNNTISVSKTYSKSLFDKLGIAS